MSQFPPDTPTLLDAAGPSSRYASHTSEAAEDPSWDAFLARVGADHTQTAAWARVKQADGWRPLRVTVAAGQDIVAGAQLLYRRVPVLGNVAYLAHGPVAVADDPPAADRVLPAIQEVARKARIRAVLIEPTPSNPLTPQQMDRHRLQPAQQRMSLGATVRVDIERAPEAILAGMRSKTRYNVRRALKRDITVRRGDMDDLASFHRLLVATGQRQGFAPASASRYRRWFDVLGAAGYLQLFLAEYRGEAVSAMLAIAFGDTVVYKRGAWTGEHGDLRPNEALHWAAMQWAHTAGYRWYDLDGIHPVAADHVLRDQPVPEPYLNSVTRFKLGFGGEVVVLPESLVQLNNPVARGAYRHVGPRLADAKQLRRLLAGSG